MLPGHSEFPSLSIVLEALNIQLQNTDSQATNELPIEIKHWAFFIIVIQSLPSVIPNIKLKKGQ